MKRRIIAAIMSVVISVLFTYPVLADDMPRFPNKDYKVAFYAYDCYHIQDENGKKSGYGYEMMQGASKYLQCTFSYVGKVCALLQAHTFLLILQGLHEPLYV